MQQLLNPLGHRRVLSQLEALGGDGTSPTGEVVATVLCCCSSGKTWAYGTSPTGEVVATVEPQRA